MFAVFPEFFSGVVTSKLRISHIEGTYGKN